MSRLLTTALALVALALALGLSACGGDDGDSGSSPSGGQAQSEEPTRPDAGGDEQSGADKGSTGSKGAGDTSSNFTPTEYSDSGGGSEQFLVPGGDNSVQEYGSEVEGEEFEQAAAALHTFFDARAQRAWAVACEQLAATTRASLEGRTSPDAKPRISCPKGLAQLTNPETTALQRKEARIDVGSLRTEGEQGFLLYRDREGVIYAIAVASDGGEWKLTNLAGLPLS